MPTIEVFADVRCPFAHVGLRRLLSETTEGGLGRPWRIRAWPLELVNAAPLDPDLIAEEVDALRTQVAPDLFAGFDVNHFPATSIPALALTAGAYAIGPELGERVALSLRWALFEEGRDIAAPAVLLDVAESHGMALPHNCEVDRVRDDWVEGRHRGVVGSPHFFAGARGWFCPALHIERVDDALRIHDNVQGIYDFLRSAEK